MRNAIYLVAMVAAVAAGAYFSFDLRHAGWPHCIYWIGVPYVVLGVIAVVRAHRDGVLLPHLTEEGKQGWLAVRGGDITRGILSAVGLVGAAWVFTHVVAPVGAPREGWLARVYLQLGDPGTLREKVASVVAVILAMAILEELVWRGLATDLLAGLVGSRRAWIWSAVLYAVAHIPTVFALRDPVAGLNPVVVLGALGCGLVWGFMARRFNRLIPSILSHAAFDWAVLMMFRLWGSSV